MIEKRKIRSIDSIVFPLNNISILTLPIPKGELLVHVNWNVLMHTTRILLLDHARDD